MTQNEVNEILEKHRKWLLGEDGGKRADLRYASLRNADLHGADLHDADLYDADLRSTDLQDTDLGYADLHDANLYEANLYGANLRYADLRHADLRLANLHGIDLYNADLRNADLRGANLSEVKNLVFPTVCPEKGSFTAFKKCENDMIIELEIPADAKRSSATSRKCRADKALVVSITNKDGTDAGVKEAYSKHDNSFVYHIGELVSVDDFCEDRWNECASGIHFFITRQEAIDY